MTILHSTLALSVILATVSVSSAFVTPNTNCNTAFVWGRPSALSAATATTAPRTLHMLRMISDENTASDDEEEEYDDDEDVPLDTVESLGRGAAKTKRGKRKGSSASSSSTRAPKAALAPEEVYYEGPPAITETIVPTISIITVVGIIPAAAAWARQAWVRYKITSRRIRVTSGIGGKDMAEIVYPDITEIRTAKRLFGDGDLVAFLRDGARFEMRNIPEFEAAIEFILKQCDPEVVKTYREKGDVTKLS